MGIVGQDNMVIGFMVSKRVRNAIDKGAEAVYRSRSDFIAFTVLWCLDNRETLTDALTSRLLGAIGSLFKKASESGDDELVPVQAVMSKKSVALVDQFAKKMLLSRVNAFALLIEAGLNESAVFVHTLGPVVKTVRKQRERKAQSGARIARNAK